MKVYTLQHAHLTLTFKRKFTIFKLLIWPSPGYERLHSSNCLFDFELHMKVPFSNSWKWTVTFFLQWRELPGLCLKSLLFTFKIKFTYLQWLKRDFRPWLKPMTFTFKWEFTFLQLFIGPSPSSETLQYSKCSFNLNLHMKFAYIFFTILQMKVYIFLQPSEVIRSLTLTFQWKLSQSSMHSYDCHLPIKIYNLPNTHLTLNLQMAHCTF